MQSTSAAEEVEPMTTHNALIVAAHPEPDGPRQNLQCFFDYCQERYRILGRRQAGRAKPWTNDPILQQWKFTNLKRNDDRTTIELRKIYEAIGMRLRNNTF